MPVFFIAFFAALLGEIGDKTQLVTLTLSTRHPPRLVLLGALAALGVITGLAVILGDYLSVLLPQATLMTAGGVIFVAVAVWTFLQSRDESTLSTEPGGSVAIKSFTMVFLAEIGDKTQLAALALTASYGAPLTVFLGMMSGQLVSHSLAAYLGSQVLSKLPKRLIRVAASLLFLLFGLFMLFSALG